MCSQNNSKNVPRGLRNQLRWGKRSAAVRFIPQARLLFWFLLDNNNKIYKKAQEAVDWREAQITG